MVKKKPTQTQLVKKADKLFSDIIRARGLCQSGRPTHAGVHQCAHGFSRRYRNVRWNELNAWCMCQGCHVYFTHRPLEWDEWMVRNMGFEDYWELRFTALDTTIKPDIALILERLKEQHKALWHDSV